MSLYEEPEHLQRAGQAGCEWIESQLQRERDGAAHSSRAALQGEGVPRPDGWRWFRSLFEDALIG